MRHTGSSTHNDARVVSTQKLPSVFVSLLEIPRISATASAIPTAAEKKLCVGEREHLRQITHRRLGHIATASLC